MNNSNNYFYEEIIKYLENNFKNIVEDGTNRVNTLKSLLTKYIRTTKAIYLLDLEHLYPEADILIRSLCEMIIDIASLEQDKEKNYEKYCLQSDHEKYNYISLMCQINNIDITTLPIEEAKVLEDRKGNKHRWNGKSVLETAINLDEININNIMSFQNLYNIIYRFGSFYSHNSGIIINNIYINLDIDVDEDEIYFHNINNLVILTTMLTKVCLPNLFGATTIFKEFDEYLGHVLKFYSLLNEKEDEK